jgi:DNA-binding NarL/FixJ family response regulator
MREAVKLGIIEDAPHVRTSLVEFFETCPEVELCAVADSVEGFLEQLESEDVLMPDVVLSDINLPGMSGIEGIRRVKALNPDVDIIMLTVFNDSDRIFKSLCAGATGYALKSTPMPEILKAIMEIRAGGSYMSPSIARKVVDHFAPAKRREEDELSVREKQVIQALSEGLSYKLIADRLSVSIDTVRTHIKHIYRKLHVNSKVEVLNKAMKGEI